MTYILTCKCFQNIIISLFALDCLIIFIIYVYKSFYLFCANSIGSQNAFLKIYIKFNCDFKIIIYCPLLICVNKMLCFVFWSKISPSFFLASVIGSFCQSSLLGKVLKLEGTSLKAFPRSSVIINNRSEQENIKQTRLLQSRMCIKRTSVADCIVFLFPA